MNNVQLLGRLTADPETRTTHNQICVSKFRLAVDKPFSKEKLTDFFTIVCFRKTAEFAVKFLKKGERIAITGSLSTGSYTDKNGNTVYTVEIIADKIFFADGKKETITESSFTDNPDFIASEMVKLFEDDNS